MNMQNLFCNWAGLNQNVPNITSSDATAPKSANYPSRIGSETSKPFSYDLQEFVNDIMVD